MIAFILASSIVLMFVLAIAVASAHSMEVRELESRWSKSSGNFDDRVNAVQKFINEEQTSGMGWIIAIMLMEFGIVVASLGGLIFGLIGVTRRHRRGLAITALVISGSTILFVCVGLVLNFV